MTKNEMQNKLREEQMMWRREPLEWDEPKEKVIMAKLKGIPGWKSDEEEECPSRMGCTKKK